MLNQPPAKWTFHKEKHFTNAVKQGIPIPILIPNDCIEQLQSKAREEGFLMKESMHEAELKEARSVERIKAVKLMIAQHKVTGKSYEDIVLQWNKELEQPVEERK